MKKNVMQRRVRCISPIKGLIPGKIYIAYEEEKPKVRIKEGPWKGYLEDNPMSLTYYSIMDGEKIIEHVLASNFEVTTMKEIRYNGGWGHPHFAYCLGEIHAPLKMNEVYQVIGIEEIVSLGLPLYCYELICGIEIVKYANSAWFSDV